MSGGPPIGMQPAIPILRIFSAEKAVEFYLGFLGFTLDWEHRFEAGAPLYAQVSRGGATLHLSEHFGDGTPGTALLIPVTGIRAFHAELTARQYRYARPGLEEAPWGALVMEVPDLFGNRLRFQERLPG